MKQHLLTLLLALAASVGTLFAESYSGTCGDNLTWTLDTESGILTISGTGAMTDYTYNSSGESNTPWYSYLSSITTVIIEDGITSIGDRAFLVCSKLTSVTIPNSVTSIGDNAFSGCSSLTSITIPNSVTSIGWYALNCSSLTSITVDYGNPNYCDIDGVLFNKNKTTLIQHPAGKSATSYTIPNSVTSIGEGAFCDCSSLTSITIPNSVTSIGGGAFSSCSSLTSITIPNSVTSIGWYAFEDCSSLTSITIPNSVTRIGDQAFYGCSSLTSITIPNSVTSIGHYAFYNCSSLTSITIPNSVTSIGQNAFYGCSSLTSVTIPNSVTSIGLGAFQYCSALTSVTIPNSVTSIEWGAFRNCSSLTSVTIPNSVTSIGGYAFQYCTSLTSITIPNSVTSIENYTFLNCSSLTSLTIPNSVTSIGYQAFRYCSSLTSITCEAVAPPTLDNAVFGDVDKSIPLYVPAQSIDLYKAAYQWKNFTNILPITSSTPQTFTITFLNYDGSELQSSEVEAGTMPQYSGITPTKPADAQYTYTFAGWDKEVVAVTGDATYTATYTRTVNQYTVTFMDGNTVLGEPQTVEYGQAATAPEVVIPQCRTLTWDKDFSNITSDITVQAIWTEIPLAEGTCGTNLTWNLDCEGLLTISGTGAMTNYTYSSNVPWYSYSESIKTVKIGSSVTSIGGYAFYNCSSLTSVTIPNSVTSIGWNAFTDCSSLTSITIPNGVTSIGNGAFGDCSSLTSITIPNSVTSIGDDAFHYCRSLTSITMGNSVTSIGRSAFDGCRSLTSITIPNGVTSIGGSAFSDCSSLTSITIPNSVTSIGGYAFYGCSKLTAVNISDIAAWYKITFDSSNANPLSFAHNLYLNGTLVTDLVIPDGVTSIKKYAFFGCNLTSITIPNSVTSIGDGAFYECSNCEWADSPARQKRKATAENDDNSPSTNYIRCEAITPPLLVNDVFGDRRYIISYDGWFISREPRTLYVPSQSVDAYKAADQWKDFNVQPIMDCGTINTTDGITVWEDQLPYTWEGISFTTAGTETKTLQASDGCDSIVTFTLRVLYRNITLQENEDADYYTQFATDYNGVTVNTATLNRQFTQGKWATLCLPFNVNKALMTSLGLYNRVFAFRYAQQLDDETIQMYFAPAQTLEAGKGYIVNANTKLAQKTSFVFPNVTINTDSDNGDITALTGYNDDTNRGNLYLVGTLRTGILQGSTTGNTYLGLKDNQLYYPNSTSGTPMRAYRAVFRSDIPVNASRLRIIAEGESVSELEVTVDKQGRMDNGQLQNNATPARKYIDNGILYIERNGITYTAQGQRID